MRAIYCVPALYAALLFSTNALATPARAPIHGSGLTVFSTVINKKTVKVEVMTREKDIGSPSGKPPTKRLDSCTYTRYPCSLVENIAISVDGKSVFVPRASFADLSDLRSADVSREHGYFILRLAGGDASEAYQVDLYFNKDLVFHRSFFPGSEADEPSEEASYKLIDID
ncbi:MAG TPA: hypothetical protein VFH59_06765 [Frateuria sp.]|uniref:hypothetical protein n=1 Tax=Frateuria sp. TaxID=2211372 RepID=UPI002D80E9D8|nr:hypothetical protein [Frateuria sp.]HET6805132.1 hypothetical protein [Frateuria sp.]